jgi:tetratricopeptide (TPR) repeat protein
VLGQLGRENEMVVHLEASIASNPQFAVAHLYLANAYLERGSLELALAHAQRGIELGPEPSLAPFGHFILADVYQRLGRKEDAAREMAIAERLRGS